jgi:hypothetical protein
MNFSNPEKNNNSKRDAMTIRIRRGALLLSGIGAFAALLVLSSCYTILRHPRIAEADYERPESNRCFDCHTDEEVYYFHYPANLGRAPVYWDDALYSPWWYNVYWSEEDTQATRYRDSLRPGGPKSIGSDGRIRTIKPLPMEPPPANANVEPDQNQPEEKKKDEPPASEKRQLRPEKKKKKKNG